jgi:hypothetical protein
MERREDDASQAQPLDLFVDGADSLLLKLRTTLREQGIQRLSESRFL